MIGPLQLSCFSVKLLFIVFPFMTLLGSGLTLVYIFRYMHMSKTIWIFLHLLAWMLLSIEWNMQAKIIGKALQ